MRNLAIALSVGFWGVAGCDSSGPGRSGQLQLTWSIRAGDASGPLLQCETGETVQVSAGGVTSSFDCATMAGVTDPVPIGTQSVTISLVSGSRVESSVTVPGVPVATASVTDLGPVTFTVGAVNTTWEIRVGTPTGAQGTCAANETVTFDFGTGLTFENVPCADMAALLTRMPPATYNVHVSLLMGTTTESSSTINSLTIPQLGLAQPQHIIFVVTQLHR